MNNAQWFLAHSKQDDDEDINQWCRELEEALSQSGWQAKVVPGRDDYATRSAALGGWTSWCRDVPRCKTFKGIPRFHGVIIPVDALNDKPSIGKATAVILQGFIKESKHVFSWCPSEKTFRKVVDVPELNEDSWVSWAQLTFDP